MRWIGLGWGGGGEINRDMGSGMRGRRRCAGEDVTHHLSPSPRGIAEMAMFYVLLFSLGTICVSSFITLFYTVSIFLEIHGNMKSLYF